MGNIRTGKGAKAGRTPVARDLCAVAALFLSIPASPAMPEPAARDSGAKGASGYVSEYREARGRHILYLEEKGGILLPVAPPVPGSRREELPAFGSVRSPQAAASRPATKPAVAPKVAHGKPASPDAVVTKP